MIRIFDAVSWLLLEWFFFSTIYIFVFISRRQLRYFLFKTERNQKHLIDFRSAKYKVVFKTFTHRCSKINELFYLRGNKGNVPFVISYRVNTRGTWNVFLWQFDEMFFKKISRIWASSFRNLQKFWIFRTLISRRPGWRRGE